ncbi:MAG: hypothetical protein IID48_14825 [Proteobacteria bacterium]|nr:hypothetical protein [Pseudomonadota bacterium]
MKNKALHPPRDGGQDAPGTGQGALEKPEPTEDKMNVINQNPPIEKTSGTISDAGDADARTHRIPMDIPGLERLAG